MALSKTRYMYGVQCPKLMWKKANEPPVSLSKVAQQRIRTGYKIEEYAYTLFPTATLVSTEKMDFYEALRKTKPLLARQAVTLLQPVFASDGINCKPDILKKSPSGWELFEVKSTAHIEPRHIQDLSFQHYCLGKCGIRVSRCFVVHPNTNYVRFGSIDPQKFLSVDDVTSQVDQEAPNVPLNIYALEQFLSCKKCPHCEAGTQCKKPTQCDYYTQCNSKAVTPEGSRPEIAHDAIETFISSVDYPVYYLDFETSQPAIPKFDGTRPYQQIPFQYSLHIVKEPGTRPEQYSFLINDRRDPRPYIAKTLLSALGDKGTIVAWHQSFEKRVIAELSDAFPEYTEQLKGLLQRFLDLRTPFQKRLYYDPAFHNSSSLKVVLPLLCPDLTYNNLALKTGEDALALYQDFLDEITPQEEWEKNKAGLVEYCGLDTLGMVRIMDYLKRIERYSCF
jgi:hypothetical protein